MKGTIQKAVGRDAYYKPDEALHELMLQEQILNTAIDIQALLRLLLDKRIITREEINTHREEVRESPKYKATLQSIEDQKVGFQKAKDNPQAYLQALFKAKMDEKIT